MESVRLTDSQILEIRLAFQESFLNNDKLWLFGSRSNLQKKGGDIDLYVETDLDITNVLAAKLAFARRLFLAFDDRKIDIVVRYKNAKEQEIYQQAIANGVQII